jgi:hypothetical protein
VQPTQQEKTILSTILSKALSSDPLSSHIALVCWALESFKNGHVDLATLATALNDPNISKLASTLSKAKMTKLAEVLEEPQVDLRKLVAALSDPDLNLDKLVATFGDSNVGPYCPFAHRALVIVVSGYRFSLPPISRLSTATRVSWL